MLHITALDLENWAQTKAAESELPRLIARLILATCPDLTAIYMPGGELSTIPGYDGTVDCITGNAFVPSGESVWEVSVRKDVQTKANEDYTLRTNDSWGREKNSKHVRLRDGPTICQRRSMVREARIRWLEGSPRLFGRTSWSYG